VGSYIGIRLLAAIPTVIGVSILVFTSLYLLPGDPVQALAGEVPLERERVEAIREELGLNDPPWEQYARFAGNALRGDLGTSLKSRRPVLDEILTVLPATLQLTLAAMAFAIVLGVGLGIIAALRAHTWIDSLTMVLALGGVSIPVFWLGLMSLLVFAVWLDWVPSTGTEGLHRLILPALVLGYAAAAIIARLTRGAMLETLSQEYVTTARSKGLGERTIITRHALRNALIPVITIVGLQIGTLLSGAVIIETVFSRQGIGRMLVNGILGKDLPLVQGTILFVATFYVIINLVTDILYAWVDPRIRLGQGNR
jgi:ABC-type dipeptide/oligopeptide/nickel transport system permease component